MTDNAAALGGSLTFVGVLPRVLDVSGELRKDVDAGCVGFPMFGGQSGVAGVQRHRFSPFA